MPVRVRPFEDRTGSTASHVNSSGQFFRSATMDHFPWTTKHPASRCRNLGGHFNYVTGNVHVTADGVLSNRMLTAAIDVLGPDRVMFGDDDPYRGMKGRFGAEGGAREFVETAPVSAENRQKLGHLNAERLLKL